MEGFQMIGMHSCGGYRLGGVGMLWRGGLILGPFATALRPLRPFILESDFDAFGQGLLRTSSLARSEGFATQLKHETSIAPLAIGTQRLFACVLDDLPKEPLVFLKKLAVFPSTVHAPQQRGRRIPQHH